MSLVVTVRHGLEFLVVEAIGSAHLQEMLDLLDLTGRTARKARQKRAMLNLIGVRVDFDTNGYLAFMKHAAGAMPPLERVACVVNQRFRIAMREQAMPEGSFTFSTFVSADGAFAWLEGRRLRPADSAQIEAD